MSFPVSELIRKSVRCLWNQQHQAESYVKSAKPKPCKVFRLKGADALRNRQWLQQDGLAGGVLLLLPVQRLSPSPLTPAALTYVEAWGKRCLGKLQATCRRRARRPARLMASISGSRNLLICSISCLEITVWPWHSLHFIHGSLKKQYSYLSFWKDLQERKIGLGREEFRIQFN